MNQNISLSISHRTIAKVIFWIIATLLAYRFIGQITHALTLLFISFFLALALNPVVSMISNRLRIKKRGGATAAAYFLVIVIIVGFFALVIPPLVSQGREFINEVPTLVSDFQQKDNPISRSINRYNLEEKVTKGASDFANNYSDFGSTVVDTGKRVAGLFVSALIVLTATFMMLVEGPKWLDKMFALMPKNKRAHRKMLAKKMYRAVSGFVNAQVIMAVIAGSFALLALIIATSLLDVTVNVVALAGIVAMLGLIPMLGNPISSAIVLLVCLANSVELALVMLIYFIVYYQIENMTVQPLIQSKLSELTPLLVFVAALIGVEFAGILGAFVAIPVATCIKILLNDQLDKRGITTNSDVTK